MAGEQHTFRGGLDWTVLAGKEIMGKSSDRVGGGEEVAGVLEAGVPFPPARVKSSPEGKRKGNSRASLSEMPHKPFNMSLTRVEMC